MPLDISKVDVWAGDIPDQPGGLANVLQGIAEAGGDFDAVIARRQPEKQGTGVVFLSPIKGAKVQKAARAAGLSPATHIANLRVEGPNRPGVGEKILSAIAEAGINLRGVSAIVIGNKFAAYMGFDSAADANAAARAIKATDKTPAKRSRR